MNYGRWFKFSLATAAIGGIFAMVVVRDGHDAVAAGGPVSWLTRSFDLSRSSANLSETKLTQANVNGTNFGSRFNEVIDDQSYAQPLYAYHVPGTGFPSQGPSNVLYVATANNSVYAFNADSGGQIVANGAIWGTGGGMINFNNNLPVPNSSEVDPPNGCGDDSDPNNRGGNGDLGILGTPVIDASASPPVLYVVTHTMEGCGEGCGPGNMTYRLRAINAVTGVQIQQSPVIGTDSNIAMFGAFQNQRGGLALSNGYVLIPFASYCDNHNTTNPTGYRGYLFTFNSLARSGSLNEVGYVPMTDPTDVGTGAGVWQSGNAPAIDTVLNDVWLTTGNGTTTGPLKNIDSFNAGGNLPGPDYSEAVIGSPVPATLTSQLTSWAPARYGTLNGHDLDLGVSGPSLWSDVPTGIVQIFQGGKEGLLYNLEFTKNQNPPTPFALQAPLQVVSGEMHNLVVALGGVQNAPSLYVAGDTDGVYNYGININSGIVSATSSNHNMLALHGAQMTLSANSGTAHTGILWVTSQTTHSDDKVTQRTFYALNADALSTVLWESDTNPNVDGLGSGVYWNPPTVANGSAYLATYNTPVHPGAFSVAAYGNRPPHFIMLCTIEPSAPRCHHGWIDEFVALFLSGGTITTHSLGVNGAMYVRPRINGSWATPTAVTAANFAPAGASVVSALQTASQADDFVVGGTGALYSIANTSSGWQPPLALTPTGLAPAGAPVAALNAFGVVSSYVVDNNGALEAVSWTSSGGWQGPVALTAANFAPPGAQLVVGLRAGGLEGDVFAIGTDGALKYMAFNGTGWTGPHVLTATNFAPPGAPLAGALDVHGYYNIMTIGNDGKLYTDWDVTAQWSGATALTGAVAPPGGGLAAINAANVALEAYFVDNTGTINWLSNAGASWTAPAAIGAAGVAEPGGGVSVAIENGNQVDLFAVSATSTSGALESTNNGSGWSALVALP